MTPRRTAGLAAAAAFAAFLPSLPNGFVLDDAFTVRANPVLADPARWGLFWTTPGALVADPVLAAQMWRPLAGHFNAALVWTLGPDPLWFHLASALLHALCAALVARLAARRAGPGAALPAALLFALHPAQAESVAYASNASALLSAAGVLGALELHASGRRRAALALGAAALFARESAAVLPLLVWAWDAPSRERRWLPHAGAVALFLAARAAVLGALGQRGPWGGDWAAHASLALRGLGLDLAHVVWPAGLRVCYSLPDAGGAAAAAVLLALAVLGALAWRGLRAGRAWAFGAAAGLFGLLPFSNLVPLDALAADRFLYLPLAGLGLAFGAAAAGWSRPRRASACAALALAFLPALLESQLRWRDGFQLDWAAYQAAPEDPCAPLNLSAHYFNWGMLARARELARAAQAPAAPAHLRAEAARRVALCDAVSAARSRASAP